ncbi:unnamed protein product [Rotaria sp. Silwood2]|nr:unnamed protein product [Rotaria sp. Silwood2]CAF4180284.1 unnamed protein product [Rotaria sp. Silwood2]CAF4231648.1 unnamed protein product [Rotaria sp. Silwood2]
MIRDEFPQTESAAKFTPLTGLVPLLPMALYPKDVLFIVMGSLNTIDRARIITETWLQWSEGNFFIFADVANDSIPFVTLPELRSKSSKWDGQHRQLLGSQWLIHNKSKLINSVKWFVFVDDDTWVNIPALLSYLRLFDHRLLLSIGYIWDNINVGGWAYFSGGAGIVFSHPAFMSVMPAIYTTTCPFKGLNDITFMHCQKQKGVTKINSDRFFYEKPHTLSEFRIVTPVSYVGYVTFHYVSNAQLARQMTCDTAAYWKRPIRGCDGVRHEYMLNHNI